MRILFWVPYPSEGPSNRFRVEQYLPYLTKGGISYSLHSFWSRSAFKVLYKRGHRFKKVFFFIVGTLSRIFDLIQIFRFDIVFIHRESYPIGGAFFERILFYLNKRIIFDFDDAIFLTMSSRCNSFIERFKRPDKIARIIGMSSFVIAGNSYLAKFAEKHNSRTCIIPTSIDTDRYRSDTSVKNAGRDRIVIGWIGSVTTSDFLVPMEGVFRGITKKFNKAEFKIVGGNASSYNLAGVTGKPWELEKEIEDLRSFDIGIMPIPDSEWAKGKCGFKAILYMSMGIPAVCSPVGVNKEIITDGKNGFFASSEGEWLKALSILIEDHELRDRLGAEGRRTVEEKYSLKANAPKFLEVIRAVYSGRRDEKNV